MLKSRPRFSLVDPGFKPADRQGRVELVIVSWIEFIVDRLDAMCYAMAAKPLVTFAIWTLWLSFLYFGLGPGSYIKVPDCGNGTLPARMVAANDFVHGELSNWMSFSGCGTDRVLNNFRLEPQSVLFGLMPGWLAYGVIMAGQRFIAGYFLCRVMRDDLGVESRAAMLSGLVYSLFNQNGIHCQWDGFTLYDGVGIPGIPLLLWLCNRLTARTWLSGGLGSLMMGMGLGLGAPYFQTLFFPFLAVFWYSVVQPSWSWKRLALLTLTFVGWAIITMPEMLAAAKYVPHSHRTEIVVKTNSPYVQVIENVEYWPAGVFRTNRQMLTIAGIALLFCRLRDRRVIATALAIAGIMIFVSNYLFFNDNVFSHLGILASFHFHRFMYMVPFLCALVLGLSLNAMPSETIVSAINRVTSLRANLHQLLIITVALLVVIDSAKLNEQRFRQMMRGENYKTLYQHPDLLALAERQKTEPDFRVAAISDMWRPGLGMTDSHRWTLSPGVLWAYGLETTDGYQVLYSLRYKQFWSEVILPLMTRNHLRSYQHLYWGNMVFLWAPTQEPLERPLVDYYNLDLLSLANTKYVISHVPLDDPDFALLPSEGRESFLAWDKRGVSARVRGALKGEWSHKPLYIYENKRCLPRYFLAKHAQLLENSDCVTATMRYKSASDYSHTVLLDQNVIPADMDLSAIDLQNAKGDESRFFAPGKIEAQESGADRLEFTVKANEPCMLFLSNSYNPSWRATIDGEATTILPANHCFQGIFIPAAGEHRIVLEYKPDYSLAK